MTFLLKSTQDILKLMRDNPIQFAVVREDPLVEAYLIEKFKINSILLVCSGGCSAISLKTLFGQLQISAFDINKAQIDLTNKKIAQLINPENYYKNFNIEDPNPTGLNQCGNFESLFRGLREFVFDFILDKQSMTSMFLNQEKNFVSKIIEHQYWPVVFSLFFSDPLLRAMFGESAIQHAPKGSYPAYFQRVFEKGFQAKDGLKNYFLHHIFLGYYQNQPDTLPIYLQTPKKIGEIHYIHGPIQAVQQLKNFGMIQLSNIMDWMSEAKNMELGSYITKNTEKGTLLLIRQLNNEQPVHRYFPEFRIDQELSDYLYSIDQSLFYSSILCLKRR